MTKVAPVVSSVVSPIKRDPTKLDLNTGKPLCLGMEDPKAPVCLMCKLNVVCREIRKSTPVDEATIKSLIGANDLYDESDEEQEEEDTEE